MAEIRDNHFSKLCEGKGELLSKALRDRILEQDFMRKSKFPIIYASETIMRYRAEKTDISSRESLREFVQGLFCSSVSEESIAGVAAFIGNHARELRDLKEGQERVLEGYAIAVDSFSLVRIDYRIWAQKCDARYISAAAGIRGVLDVKRTRWNDFLSAYMEILNLGFPPLTAGFMGWVSELHLRLYFIIRRFLRILTWMCRKPGRSWIRYVKP